MAVPWSSMTERTVLHAVVTAKAPAYTRTPFRLEGSAYVRLRVTRSIRQTYGIRKAVSEQDVPMPITLYLGDARYRADLRPGAGGAWVCDIAELPEGVHTFAAVLDERVNVTPVYVYADDRAGERRRAAGEDTDAGGEFVDAEEEWQPARADARVSVTVDRTPPQVTAAEPVFAQEPPWQVEVTGEAHDLTLDTIRWSLSDGQAGEAVIDAAGSSAQWRAAFTLADRRQEYKLRLTATDKAGNAASRELTLGRDLTPPECAFTTANGVPVTADRVELTWSGETPFVDVRGTARDDRTGVRHVEWRLEDQPYAFASPVADLWDDWYFLLPLDRPGEYTLWIKATNFVDNSVEKPLTVVVAPPVESATATVLLTPPRFPEGPIQYLATFPETPPYDGTLIEIANEDHPDPIHFVKDGFTARACEEPEATLPLARGARTTPADLAAIFGTETPVFPVVFVACLPADTPPADLPALIPIVIRYTLPRDE